MKHVQMNAANLYELKTAKALLKAPKSTVSKRERKQAKETINELSGKALRPDLRDWIGNMVRFYNEGWRFGFLREVGSKFGIVEHPLYNKFASHPNEETRKRKHSLIYKVPIVDLEKWEN